MIDRDEMALFGPMYRSILIEDLRWWWCDNRIYANTGEGREFKISLQKLPESMSLTKLLVRLKEMSLRKYTLIDCYEGIPVLDNNSDFSEQENLYLFSDGSITRFFYHKYYRNRDEGSMNLDGKEYHWDGQAYGLRCRRISEKLLDRLRSK